MNRYLLTEMINSGQSVSIEPDAVADIPDYLHSSFREKLLEHVFVAELLKNLWRKGRRDIEVLRAEVDRGGYDLVVECNNTIRHIQLKSTRAGGRAGSVNINTALADKPSGCVVWMTFEPDTLKLGPFLWFGGAPGERISGLGDQVAKHTRGPKTPRPALRVLRKPAFRMLASIDEVAQVLFGL